MRDWYLLRPRLIFSLIIANLAHNMIEQTLVLIKPDGVQRSLIGSILERLERVGLKLVALKMVTPTRDQADRHYALTEEWMQTVYSKAKAKYEANGENFPYPDYKSYGQSIKDGLVEFLVSGPVVAMVLEGEQGVSLTRKIVGATEPASSAPGTIRGDYSLDTYALSNAQNRPLRNLIHASGTVDEAKYEMPIWFASQEIMKVNGALDPIMYDEKRFK
jgi:nucleoside-diphosphate kinase